MITCLAIDIFGIQINIAIHGIYDKTTDDVAKKHGFSVWTLYCPTLIQMQIHTMKILHCQISGLLSLLSLFPKNLKIYHADKLHFVQSSLKD